MKLTYQIKVTGNRFGFIRYVNGRDANHATTKSNGLWVDKWNLEVKMARYDWRNTTKDDFQLKSGANQFTPLFNLQKLYDENAGTSSEQWVVTKGKDLSKNLYQFTANCI